MHRPLLLAMLLLAGCATRQGAKKGELVLTKNQCMIRFAVPPEWIADQQAGDFGFHSLKPAGEWQPATISVAFSQKLFTRKPGADDTEEQLALSRQYLRYWIAHGFPDTRLAADGTHTTPGGRKFQLFRESSNGLHLVALAPEQDCVVELGLHGGARDLERYRDALLAVLDSYRVK